MDKLGTILFGDPAAHVAMLREESVRRSRWLADAEFQDLVGAVSILPGPSGTVAFSRNVLAKPSKVEALLHGRAPRKGRTTRPCP